MPFIKTDDLPVKHLMTGLDGRYLHGANTTVGWVHIKQGSKMPVHAHPHEQITVMVEGKMKLWLDGEEQVLEPGLNAFIPSNAQHGAEAVTDCIVLDIFHPVREDYRV